jgi:hypothetical protein
MQTLGNVPFLQVAQGQYIIRVMPNTPTPPPEKPAQPTGA